MEDSSEIVCVSHWVVRLNNLHSLIQRLKLRRESFPKLESLPEIIVIIYIQYCNYY